MRVAYYIETLKSRNETVTALVLLLLLRDPNAIPDPLPGKPRCRPARRFMEEIQPAIATVLKFKRRNAASTTWRPDPRVPC